jgi:hypothetical protein
MADVRAEILAEARRRYDAAGQDWPADVVWAGSATEMWTLANDTGRRVRAMRAGAARRAGRWPALRARAAERRAGLVGAVAGAAFGGFVLLIAASGLTARYHGAIGGWGFVALVVSLMVISTALTVGDRTEWRLAAEVLPYALAPPLLLAAVGLVIAHRRGGHVLPVFALGALAGAAGLVGGWLLTAYGTTEADRAAVAIRHLPEPGTRTGPPLWPPGTRARITIDAAVSGSWKWLPCQRLVVLCAPPAEVTLETAGGRRRLHRADGPAVRWPDGTVEHWWHGVGVPAGALTGRWSARRIQRVRDVEVRRAAIEVLGWPEYIRRARLRLVAAAEDPGNPGRALRLYDFPEGRGAPRRRLLVMVNGSPDRDGSDRLYAETVPADLTDPVDAAAWQYGIDPATYRTLQRRT